MKYTDSKSLSHINKITDSYDDMAQANRKFQKKRKRAIKELMVDITKFDRYWVKTLSFEDKSEIYQRYIWNYYGKLPIKDFIQKIKDDGYGNLIEARNMKIDKFI